MTAPPAATPAIAGLIHLIRGQRVMLSNDLARLYGVAPRALVQAVKRNAPRFPPDFMFLTTWQEVPFLRSQIVTLKGRGKFTKYPPLAFTEQGVAMLSSVLRSERAIQINLAIMRAFVQLRQALLDHAELARQLQELEQRVASHDEGIRNLFEAIHHLMNPPAPPSKEIGFHVKEGRAVYGRRRQQP